MTAMPPKDQQDRDHAVDPSVSVHVEAPAGSGKTSVLMKRYLALLARVREPEEILALTFTRKAAGELRTRIQNELNKREDPSETETISPHESELRALALAAVRSHVDKGISLLERLQVNTFHGFCAQLLRLAPQAAGLPPDFGLLEEQESKRRQKEAVELMRRRLAALPGRDPVRQALVRRLVRLNNIWPRLAVELQGLLSRRDILGDFITLARESRDPAAYEGILREHLSTMILPGLAKLSQDFRRSDIGRQWPELYQYLADSGAGLVETLPEAVPGADLVDLNAWQAIADGILTKQGECYRSFTNKFPKKIRETSWSLLLQNLPETLVQRLNQYRNMPAFFFQDNEVDALQDLIILLHQALTTYEELCASRRSLDFTALEQLALRVLTDDNLPELFNRLDRRLTHLLVDEFQDTSVNQINLLCCLLTGWQGDRRHSLMVVGDPKQSIYGWRQARVELFFKSRLDKRLPCPEAPPFEILTLETNFRSTSKLIEWVNLVFGVTIMPDKDTSGVEFHAAKPKPGADIGSPPQLALFNGPDRQQAREREAAWLAGELSRLQKTLSPKETVGVLIFVRTHLPVYLQAFRQAGLNPRVRDGLRLDASLAVQHLHNVARALVRPHDDVAWAALLRGFAGPQPLGLLAEIATVAGDFWYEKIRQYAASPDGLPEVRRFYQSLDLAGKRVGREPLHEILAAWLTQRDGPGVEAWPKAAAWEGPQGVANVKAYLDLVAAAAAASPEATLIQTMDLLAEAYQPPDPRAQDSPVEILTVHAAKGLEYDYVYLPHLDWEPLKTAKHDAPFLMEEVSGTGNAVFALNRPYIQKEQSVLYRTLKTAANQSALGEARRLFYVAVTRAKKHLQMSGVVMQNKAGDWQFPSNSPLGWLRRHYGDSTLDFGTVNLWESPLLPVTISDEVSILSANPEALKLLPRQYDVQPEPWPYEIHLPSQLATEAAAENSRHSDSLVDPTARVRGEISHRLLETLSLGENLPEPEAVAPALLGVAGSAIGALKLAQDILAEVRACQTDPFLAPLLAPNLPVVKSEWGLEAWHSPATLYRGQIDRLVFDGKEWWLLDYKTSRPAAGVDWEDFIASEVEKYRPQLLAYREMAAKFFDVTSPEIIKIVLYFTATSRHVVL